jgi:hypothetical protein
VLTQPPHCRNGVIKIDVMDITGMPAIAPFAVWVRERDESVHRESQREPGRPTGKASFAAVQEEDARTPLWSFGHMQARTL